MVTDENKIDDFHEQAWKACSPEEGGERDGGRRGPRVALPEETPSTVMYFVRTTCRTLVSVHRAKAMVIAAYPRRRTIPARTHSPAGFFNGRLD